MTILDSDIFASAGGGSMAKLYKPGMVVKQGESVRSLIDASVYVRFGSSPESLTLNVDPSVYYGEFTLDDNSFPIGTFKQYPNIYDPTQSVLIEKGQWWLRTGNYLAVESLPSVRQPLPDHIVVHGDYFQSSELLAVHGLSGTMMDSVGDGNGNWMCVNSAGTIFASINDGVNWSALAQTTTNYARLATNKAGRWWYCDSTSNLYVSDNMGASWTLQTVNVGGSTTTCGLLKFTAGRLFFGSNTLKVIAHTSTSTSTILHWILDSNSTSVIWSEATLNPTQFYPNWPNGSNFQALDAVWDGNDTVWFGGLFGTWQFSPMVFKLSTNTFVVPTVANSTYSFSSQWRVFLGMYLDGNGNCVFYYHRPYQDTSIGDSYPTAIVTPAGVTSSIYGSIISGSGALPTFSSYPLSNVVRVGLSVFGCLGGSSNSPVGTTVKIGNAAIKLPAITGGNTFPSASSLRVTNEANGTIIVIGTQRLWRSIPVVGRVPRSIAMAPPVTETNFTDYVRVV